MTAALRRSFDSLQVPNYRRYFVGQIVSLSGNWMQTVAEIWLILSLTDSGVAVGLTTALQFLPMLLFGAWGGLLADRLPKRRLLIVTQALMALPALALFAVSASGAVTPLIVYALVFARGAVNAVDNPTRQSFVIEMVGTRPGRQRGQPQQRPRPLGSHRRPGARRAADRHGRGRALLRDQRGHLRRHDLRAVADGAGGAAPRAPGAARAGRGAIGVAPRGRDAPPRGAAGPDGHCGTLGYNFQTVLPLLARFSFGGGATVYAALVSAMAVGSVAGALVTGARGHTSARLIAAAALAFGVLSLLAAGAPTLALELPVLALLGAATVTFAASVNSYLQLEVRPDMRGRVMALYSIVFLGSTPIGGPIAGWLSEAFDPRVALVLAGVSGLSAAWAARTALARVERENPARIRVTTHRPEEARTDEHEMLIA